MNYEPQENLEELIAEEKRLLAAEHLLEAWEAALCDGIESEIIATSFARSLLRKIARERGNDAASNLLGELVQMDDSGDFIPGKTLQ